MSTTINKQSPTVSPVPKHEGAPDLAPLQTDAAANNSNPPSAVPSSAVTESGTDSAAGPIRRKPSRRANTAERRATHNAVERQRRETLNGRFLDLAGMLPNLQSVRRPSKSAIVNSSIALIHQQRRARGVAARELRLLKSEADMLRREVNEWRERARMPPVEEPMRSQDFHILMTVEEVEENDEERAAYAAMNAVDEADEDEYGDGQDELSDRPASGGRGAGQGMQGYGHNMGHGMSMPMGMMPMNMGGMGGMGMPMPQRGYAPQHTPTHPNHQYGASQQQMGLDFSTAPTMFDSGQDKTAAWTQQQQQQLQQQQQQQQMINMMQNQNQQMPTQQWQQAQLAQTNPTMSMFTPPGSSHGASAPAATTPPASNPLVQQAQQAFLANYQRNAQLFPGSGAAIPTLSGMGFQAPTTQAITPPSSIHDGDAGVSVSAPMVADGMNSVHSSPSGSARSGSASVHSRASPEGHFSLSPPVPVTTANVTAGMSTASVPFMPSHTRRTSSGGLAVPQPAPALGTTMPWMSSNMTLGVGVGGGYAASGLSLFA